MEKADAMLPCIADRLVAPALLLGEEGVGVLKLIAEEGKEFYGSVPAMCLTSASPWSPSC